MKEHLTSKHGLCRKSHWGKERFYQCGGCKFMFENEERQSNHYCRYTLNEDPEWGKNHCKICDMKFPRRDSLLQHNKTFHVTEKKFHCDQCDFKVNIAFFRNIKFKFLNKYSFKLSYFSVFFIFLNF